MAYKVFISYSTKDLYMADLARNSLSIAGVEVFLAEYSVQPSARLNLEIELALRGCDLFVLLWSRNSKASDYVPQEIGMARACGKTILPMVMESGLAVPGFVSDLKYIPAYQNPAQSLAWVQAFVAQNAAQQQQQTSTLVILALLGLIVWAANRN
jgi:hypothetical protein